MNRSGRPLTTTLVVVVWLLVVAIGFAALAAFKNTPGAQGAGPTRAGLPGWALTVFLHPHCPCSSTTLDELREVVQHAGPALDVRVAFVRPPGVAEGWERGDGWNAALRVPGARVDHDAGSAEARAAGATTSGHVVLRDPQGRVVFRGGITRGRGHAGNSSGRRAILALVRGESGDAVAPVFGCPLFGSDDCGDTKQGGEACRP